MEITGEIIRRRAIETAMRENTKLEINSLAHR
jgi:hypothetical protein